MAGIFTMFPHGKVKDFSNQHIETDFILLVVPVNSYFVRQTTEGLHRIPIPLNGISLRAFYIPLLLMIGPFVLLFSGIILNWWGDIFQDAPRFVGYLPFLTALALSGYGIYRLVTDGKPTPHEIKRRTVLEIAMDLNAQPEWFSAEDRTKFFEKLTTRLPADWRQRIATQTFPPDLYYALYAAIYYDKTIAPTAEKEQLFIMLDKRINKDLYNGI
jgi:hypothetical protein